MKLINKRCERGYVDEDIATVEEVSKSFILRDNSSQYLNVFTINGPDIRFISYSVSSWIFVQISGIQPDIWSNIRHPDGYLFKNLPTTSDICPDIRYSTGCLAGHPVSGRIFARYPVSSLIFSQIFRCPAGYDVHLCNGIIEKQD